MAEKPFPILFVASTRLGDAVLSSGLVKRLHDEVPNARFTLVAGAASARLFSDVPGLEQIIVEEEGGAAPGFRLWLKTRGRLWGLIVDLRGTGVSGFLRRRRRAVLKPTSAPIHKVVQAARLLRLEDDPPAPFLFTSPEVEAAAADRTAGRAPILAIAPGASWVGKAWPAERFAAVAARLLAPGGPLPDGRLMILGDVGDREAGRAVKLAVSRDRIIAEPGQLDPLTTYACLKRARLVIGNDSAAVRLAAAAGAPTLTLYGPSDERIEAPWGPRASVLRGPRDLEAFRKLDPDLDQAICHMLDLSVDTVLGAAKRALAETERDDG
ncbi:MAG: glycosyltransferase family 9 protein [Caulobacteraceae bacterium]|nr:glycosyltransferase family 9 protein [Caulobacteraceae bacterium]